MAEGVEHQWTTADLAAALLHGTLEGLALLDAPSLGAVAARLTSDADPEIRAQATAMARGAAWPRWRL